MHYFKRMNKKILSKKRIEQRRRKGLKVMNKGIGTPKSMSRREIAMNPLEKDESHKIHLYPEGTKSE